MPSSGVRVVWCPVDRATHQLRQPNIRALASRTGCTCAALRRFIGHFRIQSWMLIQQALRNLLLVGRTVKIADFGLASRQGLYSTQKGMMGTPYFAPPELYSSNSNAGTDQFSLAVTYCYLRTGHYPYEFDPQKPPQGNPELSRFTPREREALQRALQIHWIDRFPSCGEFMEHLRAAL